MQVKHQNGLMRAHGLTVDINDKLMGANFAYKGGGIGSIVSGVLGQAVGNAILPGIGGALLGGALGGGLNSALSGGKFIKDALTGAAGGGLSYGAGALFNPGATGGILDNTMVGRALGDVGSSIGDTLGIGSSGIGGIGQGIGAVKDASTGGDFNSIIGGLTGSGGSGGSSGGLLDSLLSTIKEDPLKALMVGGGIANKISDFQNSQDYLKNMQAQQAAATAQNTHLAGVTQDFTPLNRTYQAPTGDLNHYGEGSGQLFFNDVNPNATSGSYLKFAKGGHVPDTGSILNAAKSGDTDTVHAMLTPGEYVLNRDDVSSIGGGSNKKGAAIIDSARKNNSTGYRLKRANQQKYAISSRKKSPQVYVKKGGKTSLRGQVA